MRLPNVLEWLDAQKPDVVLLQEIKCENDAFPAMEFKAAGYDAAVHGQKSYNGVAILSKHAMTDVRTGLPGGDDDAQARYIEAVISGVRIASIYLPNGNPINDPKDPTASEKYAYKLRWMARLKAHAKALLQDEMPVVLGGDYNVIPEAIDVYDPKNWVGDALYHPITRATWTSIVEQGYTEAFRALHPGTAHAYSFWDYQAGSWQRDAGLRIDHFLLSPEACDRMSGCFIDKAPRGKDKASDHTPVILDIA
jgi:exodeoxyribonuclease-3